jgi:hypothetical protein
MDKNDLLTLYATAVNEQRSCAEDHHKRIVWFASLLSTLGAATVAGVFKAHRPFHWFVLITGPVAMILIADIAIEGTRRLYQRFLECITFRAKIEYHLGLMRQRDTNPDGLSYLGEEALIPTRHMEDFQESETPEEPLEEHGTTGGTRRWVEERVTEGYQKSAMRLFNASRWLSICLLVLVIGKTLYELLLELSMW